MKLYNYTLTDIRIKKTNALKLIGLIFFFFCFNNMPNSFAKSLSEKEAKQENFLEKETNKMQNKIEDQPLTINLFNNLTYFVGSAEGFLSLKSDQLNIKNKNYYSSVMNFKMNKTDIQTIQNMQLKNQIIKDQKLIQLNDFLDYFPNMGRMVSENEMAIDLRYLWKCQYERKIDGLIYTINTDFITKESSTQHGFKVQFKITDKTTYLPAIKEFFEKMVKNCKATQKSSIELKRALHKLMVKYLNLKTLMRILKEKKNGQNPSFNKIPLKPNKKSRANFENMERNSNMNFNNILKPNSTKARISAESTMENSNQIQNQIAVDSTNLENENNGEAIMEDDDSSEAMRLFFIEKGFSALSNAEDEEEEELFEASFLENSEKEEKEEKKSSNSTIQAAKGRISTEFNAQAQAMNANGEKGIFSSAKKFIGNLFGGGKKPAPKPAPKKPAAKPAPKPAAKKPKKNKNLKKKGKKNKTPADLLIKRPDIKTPLNKTEIKDPVALLKYEKKEEELKNKEKSIEEMQNKKEDLKKNLKEMEGKQTSEEQNRDVLKNKLQITRENIKKSKLVISMTQKENKKLLDKIKALNEKKIKLEAKLKDEKKAQAAKAKDIDMEKGIFDNMKKDKRDIRGKVTDLQDLNKEQGKKMKSADEIKNEILKNLKEAKLTGDNIDKDISVKNDDIKSKQNEHDDLKQKITKLEGNIQKQVKAIDDLGKKILEVSKKIDKKGEEETNKKKSASIMRLNPMEKTLKNSKDALKAVMDPALQEFVEQAYNIVIDKDNNDINNYLKQVNNLPSLFIK